MRLAYGLVLIIGIPGLLFLALWPFVGWRWALPLPIVWNMLAAYGFFFGWRHIVVKTATCTSPLLPKSFDGYRVVQLSDIHIGTEEVIPFQHILKEVCARDGVYSVMGNHDYCEYGEDKSKYNIRRNQNVLKYLEEKAGWHLLLNEHVVIRRGYDAIGLIGVENISRPPFPDYGDLHKALGDLPKGMFKILLSHDPSHWRRGVLHQTDIALTLSGHTHAGQIRVGRFSPAKWAYNEWGGKYVEDGSMLYVSLGIGGTVPFRFGAWPPQKAKDQTSVATTSSRVPGSMSMTGISGIV